MLSMLETKHEKSKEKGKSYSVASHAIVAMLKSNTTIIKGMPRRIVDCKKMIIIKTKIMMEIKNKKNTKTNQVQVEEISAINEEKDGDILVTSSLYGVHILWQRVSWLNMIGLLT